MTIAKAAARLRRPLLLLAAVLFSGCSLVIDLDECKSDDDCLADGRCVSGLCEGRPIVEIHENIGRDTTWTADHVYLLKSLITVVSSVTLTIEPGTTVLGDRRSALVVRPGGRLIASGTREAPIVFTSAKRAGQRLAGDWGGVALLGKARVNRKGAYLNIVTDEAEATFGGTDDADNCGVLKYVRIEFGGGRILGDEALNGLTFAGCGSATSVDYVHLHFGDDDGLEIFGGTVDVRHVLITRSQDDAVDIDLGWRGTAQFLAVQQDAAADNGIEVDNLGEDPLAEPLTNFHMYNVTLIGAHGEGLQRGLTFKAGGAGFVSHALVMGQSVEAVDVFGVESGDQARQGNIVVRDSLFFDIGGDPPHYFPRAGEDGEVGEDGTGDDDGGFDEDGFFRDPATGNVFDRDPEVAAPYDLLAPDLRPARTHTTGGDVPPPPEPFDILAVYRGAFQPEVDPWTESWTAFPEK